MSNAPAPPDPVSQTWDVIVVGAGMGGATLGHALAQQGRSVLFLEKGRSHLFADPAAIFGGQVENNLDLYPLSESEARAALARGGRSTDVVEDVTGKRPKTFTPFIGSGTGGSSALYGMVCERLFPSDFEPRRAHRDLGDSTAPEAWPIRYQELLPWYEAAERHFRVRGTPDPFREDDRTAPLMTSPPLTAANQDLFDFFQRQGLHPYQLHMACEHVPECQTCQSYLCSRECKNDASNRCLAPAIQDHGARLLSECVVLRLEADGRQVKRVVCRWQGREIVLEGKLVVLAAGALATPALLLASKSADWPNGLANDTDQVGRNLMRHCIDLVLIKPRKGTPISGQIKEVGLNDFYETDEGKLGTIQSAGPAPPLDFLLHQPGPMTKWIRLARPVLSWFWRTQIPRQMALAAIMEDLPYARNRITPGEVAGDGVQRIRLEYHLHDAERRRQKIFRRKIAQAMKPYKPFILPSGADNKPIAHATGTCRFGDDPKTSVLDRFNRAHSLDNLYVVDGSFFPSSGGLNPSLTIAANALRVAAHLKDRF
jgi:choline dehydrogenase-like flavoprotein